ncbi:hypothetical protein CRG98_012589 [Punica granatum]|uniref:Uncharacterized protein n=1 Tax=Punica granatum TaxID=22663 RepID=A0A2I0KEW3_PUNGR|nr:hypothetical protein CRG98_012589 [Punica granatum]
MPPSRDLYLVREKIVWKSGRNFGRSGTRSGLADPTGEEQRLGGEKAGPGCSSCFSQLAKELWALRGSLEEVKIPRKDGLGRACAQSEATEEEEERDEVKLRETTRA